MRREEKGGGGVGGGGHSHLHFISPLSWPVCVESTADAFFIVVEPDRPGELVHEGGDEGHLGDQENSRRARYGCQVGGGQLALLLLLLCFFTETLIVATPLHELSNYFLLKGPPLNIKLKS